MSMTIRTGSSIRLPVIPPKQKLVLLVCGGSILIVSVLTRFWFKLRKRKDTSTDDNEKTKYVSRGLNGDIPQMRSMPSPLCIRCRQSREANLVPLASLNTVTSIFEQKDDSTPQQFGVMGMEALDTAIHYWEDAINAFQRSPSINGEQTLALPSNYESEFVSQLNIVMRQAFKLRDNTSKLFLDNTSLLFRIADDRSSVTGVPFRDFDWFDVRTVTSFDDESFVSAEADIANLHDFEDLINPADFGFYQTALNLLKTEGVPARAIRTNLVNCQSDEEYLAKLHCIRLAFQHLSHTAAVRQMYIDAGSQIIGGLLVYAERDPKDCLESYTKLIEWVSQPQNKDTMEQELRARGVTALTIYDVVFDFLLIEAFEDLEDPPQSVVSVIQNRWLSANFRERALSTAIWSVIKAKKGRVKVENGFFSHFYGVAENLTPVLAWGFLGTNKDLRESCSFFKQEVMNLMIEMFDFRRVRFTDLPHMAEDIYVLSQNTVDRIAQRLGI